MRGSTRALRSSGSLLAMKQKKQCPKCDSLQIGHVSYQPDLGPGNRYSVRTLGVEHQKPSIFDSWQKYVGTLEAYVCANCGYYESYVTDPAKVDWSKVSGLRWINPPAPSSDTPFR